jgi:transcription-repair coupling factor (superfamily II helicase)
MEFFGDEIESIREFDPDSQRSIAFLNETRLVPNAGFSENGHKEPIFSYMPDDTLMVLENADVISEEIGHVLPKSRRGFIERKKMRKLLPHPSLSSPDEWNSALETSRIHHSRQFQSSVPADTQYLAHTVHLIHHSTEVLSG